MSQYKRYIACHYKEKEEAKVLGARWEPKVKLWYAPNLTTYKKLNRWHIKRTEPQLVIHKKSEPPTTAPPTTAPPTTAPPTTAPPTTAPQITYIDLKDVSNDDKYYVYVPGHGYVDEDLADMYSIPDYD
jgi:hypothetical protein